MLVSDQPKQSIIVITGEKGGEGARVFYLTNDDEGNDS